jgi:hypothetical protein
MPNPTEDHYCAAKKVLRYLQGTFDFGIRYKHGGKGEMEVFTDSDFGGDANKFKSTSGYMILWDGVVVFWQSKKQKIVALSSTEAEYIAATVCVCQVIWIREVLNDLGALIEDCTTVKCDNTYTIELSKHTMFHGRCKHIGVRFHFLRDMLREGEIELEHCSSKVHTADIMTKLLKGDTYEDLRMKLSVCSVRDKV